jgi:acetylornithine deacetylase/succinyl-diaminopimelate desuccinylase-like protein
MEVQMSSSPSLTISDLQLQGAIGTLGKLVSIPSVSNKSSPDYKAENLQNAADFVFQALKELNFKAEKISIEGSAPYVVAEYISNHNKPTLTYYGHYDVQPVDRTQWRSDPFVLQERDERLYGRGASDNKGGIVAILSTIKVFQEAGRELPVNVRIFVEGEEEIGSTHMRAFIQQEAKRIISDALIVMDGSNKNADTGTLATSTRGIVNLKVRVDALANPIHSGQGCLAPDPALALCKVIASLEDPRAIPGLLDGASTVTEAEKEFFNAESISEQEYRVKYGVNDRAQLRGDPTKSIYERTLSEPSITVINMIAGQPNGGNSIQAFAEAAIGVRVLPGQNPERVSEAMINHISSQQVMYNLPMAINLTEAGSWAWKANLEGRLTQLYFASLKENFSKIAPMPMGGAIPLLYLSKDLFPEIILPGVEDDKTAAHSHNESQNIKLLKDQINSNIAFMLKVASLPKKGS